MKEKEVKILNIDKAEVEERLLKLGAKKVFDGEIASFFFDFKDGSIAKSNSVLRLRKEGIKVLLTFKKVVDSQSVKVAEEHYVEVSDLGEAEMILKSLGLSVAESMQKRRVSYQFNCVHFDIDKYVGKYGHIPVFLEIEAESIDSIYRYAELLGFKAEDCLPWSVKELVNHYPTERQSETK